MKKLSVSKRILAALLSLVVIVGVLPSIPLELSARAAEPNVGRAVLPSSAAYERAVAASAYRFPTRQIYTWGKLDASGAFMDTPGSVYPVEMTRDELLYALFNVTDAFGEELTDTPQPDYAYDVPANGSLHAGVGYSQNTLNLLARGAVVSLGNVDLSRYSEVQIHYGADENARFADVGTRIVLTTTGAVENAAGVADPDADIIAAQTLDNSTGHWAEADQTVSMPLTSPYAGPVYLSLLMKSGDGVSVTGITFVGKDATYIDVDAIWDIAAIELCSASGSSVGVNPLAALDPDTESITYTPASVGVDAYYYRILADGQSYGPIEMRVCTYAVTDRAYALDYGLSAELTSDGLYTGNVVSLLQNLYGTSCAVRAVETTSHYGTFDISGENCARIVYSMERFMSGADRLRLELTVREDGTDPSVPVDKFTGVVMEQLVEVVPAGVMYYEDTFPSINYFNSPEELNIWQTFCGGRVETMQSVDMEENYGSDPAYRTNTAWRAEQPTMPSYYELTGTDAAADTLLGDASNDTIHVLRVRERANREILQFEFTGTGFEILSRTTQHAYAILTVKVERKLESGEWDPHPVKVMPVISECIGGDLYQIPLVDRRDMEHGEYRVTVYTSNTKQVDRTVYIDGVRIYQPLEPELQARYYKATEANATFHKIKNEIRNGNIVFGEVGQEYDRLDDAALKLMFGYTTIENYRETATGLAGWVLTNTQLEGEQTQTFPLYAKDEYMAYGPNNEIYLLGGNGGVSFIALYLKEDPSVDASARSIQVGAQVRYNASYDMFDNVYGQAQLLYAGTAEDIYNGAHSALVASGTEQYITIDHRVLTKIGDRYLLFIGRENNGANFNTLSLTNLKLNGFELVGTDDGDVSISTEMNAVLDYYDRNVSTAMAEAVKLAALVNDLAS